MVVVIGGSVGEQRAVGVEKEEQGQKKKARRGSKEAVAVVVVRFKGEGWLDALDSERGVCVVGGMSGCGNGGRKPRCWKQ